MSKQTRDAAAAKTPPVQTPKSGAALPVKLFGRANWILLILGVVLLALGYFTLGLVDARAENTAGVAAPLLIVGGYITLFIAILLRPE